MTWLAGAHARFAISGAAGKNYAISAFDEGSGGRRRGDPPADRGERCQIFLRAGPGSSYFGDPWFSSAHYFAATLLDDLGYIGDLGEIGAGPVHSKAKDPGSTSQQAVGQIPVGDEARIGRVLWTMGCQGVEQGAQKAAPRFEDSACV